MLRWEEIKCEPHVDGSLYRAKVPGGWLLLRDKYYGVSITFYPDPDHRWDGSSLS